MSNAFEKDKFWDRWFHEKHDNFNVVLRITEFECPANEQHFFPII